MIWMNNYLVIYQYPISNKELIKNYRLTKSTILINEYLQANEAFVGNPLYCEENVFDYVEDIVVFFHMAKLKKMETFI